MRTHAPLSAHEQPKQSIGTGRRTFDAIFVLTLLRWVLDFPRETCTNRLQSICASRMHSGV